MPSRLTVFPLGITMGDAAGIGPEIIVKAWAEGLGSPAVVYGDADVMRRAVKLVNAPLTVIEIADISQADSDAGCIEVVRCGPTLPGDLPAGKVSAAAGRGAYEYLCTAIDDAQAGRLRAIVTAPLNKKSMHQAGIDYAGHTEILADRCGIQDIAMMLANNELRVILVTVHSALAQAITRITLEAELRTIRLGYRTCRQLGIERPRVAVAGLNPHAGEGGKFGREELDIIEPAIALAREQGIDVSGPWPGDTVFMRARQGDFDIVVAQYHDQGLIPIKYLGLEQGVNVTVGLPFIRTSVDHGTAFDIAWQGVANHRSLTAAFNFALRLAH